MYGRQKSRNLRVGLTCASLLCVIPSSSTLGAAAPSEVWLGAPFSGTLHPKSACNSKQKNLCPFPSDHWIQYGGDWSIDLPKAGGSGIYLYLAPQFSRDSVRAQVESVKDACKRGLQGGKVVRVGVYLNDEKIGTIAYSHVAGPVKEGPIDRWGGKIGEIFKTTNENKNSSCWLGPHLHMEVSSVKGFSCFNKGIKPSLAYEEKNFFGFVTGSRAKKLRQACP